MFTAPALTVIDGAVSASAGVSVPAAVTAAVISVTAASLWRNLVMVICSCLPGRGRSNYMNKAFHAVPSRSGWLSSGAARIIRTNMFMVMGVRRGLSVTGETDDAQDCPVAGGRQCRVHGNRRNARPGRDRQRRHLVERHTVRERNGCE